MSGKRQRERTREREKTNDGRLVCTYACMEGRYKFSYTLRLFLLVDNLSPQTERGQRSEEEREKRPEAASNGRF